MLACGISTYKNMRTLASTPHYPGTQFPVPGFSRAPASRLDAMERQMRQKSENRLANSENRLLCLQNRLANSENQLSCLQNRLANSENRLSCLQNRLSCLQNRLPNSIIVFAKSICHVCKIDLSCLQNRLERRMRQKSENRLANSENRSSCCQNRSSCFLCIQLVAVRVYACICTYQIYTIV